MCFNVYSLSHIPFTHSPITAAAVAIQNLNQRAAYSFISSVHITNTNTHSRKHTEIFTGLYGSAECICLLPLESKHHLLMNKLSDPLSFIHSLSCFRTQTHSEKTELYKRHS